MCCGGAGEVAALCSKPGCVSGCCCDNNFCEDGEGNDICPNAESLFTPLSSLSILGPSSLLPRPRTARFRVFLARRRPRILRPHPSPRRNCQPSAVIASSETSSDTSSTAPIPSSSKSSGFGKMPDPFARQCAILAAAVGNIAFLEL